MPKRKNISKTREEKDLGMDTTCVPANSPSDPPALGSHSEDKELITVVVEEPKAIKKNHSQVDMMTLRPRKEPHRSRSTRKSLNRTSAPSLPDVVKKTQKQLSVPKLEQHPVTEDADVSDTGELSDRSASSRQAATEAQQNVLMCILQKDVESLEDLLVDLKRHTKSYVNFRDGKDRSSLLHRCVIQGDSLDIMRILLDKNATIDITDAHRQTPLHLSAAKGDVKSTEFLLDSGANCMAKNSTNQTPLHCSALSGHLACLELLVGHHALVNLQDQQGWTALHYAAKHEHPSCVDFLLRHGAQARSVTNEGKRPFDLVQQVSDPKHKNKLHYTPEAKVILKLLKKAGGAKNAAFPSGSNIMVGSGNIRSASIGHQKRSTFSRAQSSLAVMNDSRTHADEPRNGSGPVKFERGAEQGGDSDDDPFLEADETPSTPSASSHADLVARLDKFGFIIDENSHELSATEKQKEQKKAAKDNERAHKWITLIKSHVKSNGAVDMEGFRGSRRVSKLADQGIPSEVRGQVWKLLAGIEARDDKVYYRLLEEKNWVKSIHDQILRDIDRTMPRHILFREKGHGQTMLTNVLLAYSSYRPDVGYCQGMGFITAMFLMYMPEEDAFWQLDQLAGSDYNFGIVWEESMTMVKQLAQTLGKLLETKYPKVYATFEEHNIPVLAFSSQFFITGFMYNLPFDMAARVWDAFWLRKFDFLYAVALAIVKLTKDRLIGAELEVLMNFFQFKEETNPISFSADQLVDTSISQFSKLKIPQIRKWEGDAAAAIKAELALTEERKKKFEVLEQERRARLEEKQAEELEEVKLEEVKQEAMELSPRSEDPSGETKSDDKSKRGRSRRHRKHKKDEAE